MKTDIKALIEIFKKLLYIFTAKQKARSLGVLIIILFGSLFETLGVSIIIPFIEAMMNPQELIEKWYIAPILNVLHISDSNFVLVLMGCFVILIYVVKNLFLILTSYVQTNFRWSMQKELSVKMLNSYMKRPYTYFLDVNSSKVLRGVNDDVNGVYMIVEYFFNFISEILTILLISIYLCMTDFGMALGVLIIALCCFLSITTIFRRLLKNVGLKNREALAEQNKYVFQAVNGIKEIHVTQRKGYFVNKYSEAYEITKKTATKFNFLSACPERIIEAVCICGIIVTVCIRLQNSSDIVNFVPVLAAFAVAAFRILPLIARIISQVNALVYYRTGIESTYNNLHEVEAYERIQQEYKVSKLHKKETIHEKRFIKSIEIKNIYWKYPNSTEQVLKDLSITINKSESVAFIGKSGAGKTTLADVILGLLKPQEGTIEVDGVDIYAIPKQWSEIIGFVPQNVYLIDDTIRANVSFGIDSLEISDELIWQALDQAQLKQFVESLPKGLDTLVGERGIKFSGGQRQRIVIARALYNNPDILILDEATSALDTETEAALMESIEELQGHKTLIIVAHRLSTIQNCDKIYKIENGRAVLQNKQDKY